MSTVCNAISSPLTVGIPQNCSAFVDEKISQSPCGAGTSSASCSLSISGGIPPYSTSFSYLQSPRSVYGGASVNMGAFTGGSGSNPQFGFAFSAPNMCEFMIIGQLQVAFTVRDSSGQESSGNMQYTVRLNREVNSAGGCDCTAYGPRCYEFMGGCLCPGESDIRMCNP
jgi:hypothetical protein